MNTGAIRTEMLKCHANFSTGIMKAGGDVYLVWNNTNEMHTETLSADRCAIVSREFESALERARIGLVH